jgi:hypothetical protein
MVGAEIERAEEIENSTEELKCKHHTQGFLADSRRIASKIFRDSFRVLTASWPAGLPCGSLAPTATGQNGSVLHWP